MNNSMPVSLFAAVSPTNNPQGPAPVPAGESAASFQGVLQKMLGNEESPAQSGSPAMANPTPAKGGPGESPEKSGVKPLPVLAGDTGADGNGLAEQALGGTDEGGEDVELAAEAELALVAGIAMNPMVPEGFMVTTSHSFTGGFSEDVPDFGGDQAVMEPASAMTVTGVNANVTQPGTMGQRVDAGQPAGVQSLPLPTAAPVLSEDAEEQLVVQKNVAPSPTGQTQNWVQAVPEEKRVFVPAAGPEAGLGTFAANNGSAQGVGLNAASFLQGAEESSDSFVLASPGTIPAPVHTTGFGDNGSGETPTTWVPTSPFITVQPGTAHSTTQVVTAAGGPVAPETVPLSNVPAQMVLDPATGAATEGTPAAVQNSLNTSETAQEMPAVELSRPGKDSLLSEEGRAVKEPMVIRPEEFGIRLLGGKTDKQGQPEGGLGNSRHQADQVSHGVKTRESGAPSGLAKPVSVFSSVFRQIEKSPVEFAVNGQDAVFGPEALLAPVANTPLQDLSAAQGIANPDMVAQPREVLEQIVQGAHIMVRDGATEMQIRLYPEELGRVELKIVMEREGLQAHFLTESETVKALIETNLPQLKNALQQSGLQADNLSVSIGEQWAREDMAGSGGQQQGFHQGNPRRWTPTETADEPERFEVWTTTAVWQGQVNITA